MKKRIILERFKVGWFATFQDEEGGPDQEIKNLFGSHIIPTAFTCQASCEKVRAEIQALNPEHYVRVAGIVK